MHPTGAESERSVRRSRARMRVLILLSSLGEAYPRQLAKATGLDATRLKWILHGHLPQYKPELSLIPLGLVRERASGTGKVYECTNKGRRKARSLTARARDGKGPLKG
jgi:predicted transcriptional regulator with HTH domain